MCPNSKGSKFTLSRQNPLKNNSLLLLAAVGPRPPLCAACEVGSVCPRQGRGHGHVERSGNWPGSCDLATLEPEF